MIVPSHSCATMLQRFNRWRLANRHSLPLSYLFSNILQALAIAAWASQTKLNALLVKTCSIVVHSRLLKGSMARRGYTWQDHHKDCRRMIRQWRSKARGCTHLEFSASRDQAAADDSSANRLAGAQRFVFGSQEWRPPWLPAQLWFEVTWRLRLYATQCRLCSLHRMHGCPAA